MFARLKHRIAQKLYLVVFMHEKLHRKVQHLIFIKPIHHKATLGGEETLQTFECGRLTFTICHLIHKHPTPRGRPGRLKNHRMRRFQHRQIDIDDVGQPMSTRSVNRRRRGRFRGAICTPRKNMPVIPSHFSAQEHRVLEFRQHFLNISAGKFSARQASHSSQPFIRGQHLHGHSHLLIPLFGGKAPPPRTRKTSVCPHSGQVC